MKTVLPLF